MRNIEVLRDYFLGKDPQLKETLADNSLRLIGIEGKHFVLRTELIEKLKELKDYVDEKDQELAEAIQNAIEALDGDISALREDLGTETTNRENADIIIRSVADSALDLATENQGRINGINDRVTNIEAWKDTWEDPSEYVLVDDLITRLSNYYTKAQVDSLIAAIPTLTYEVVQTLPTHDISDRTIYLVPSSDPELGNIYEEYMYIGNTWEMIGTTAVDLSNYVTKSGLAQATGSATNNAMSQAAVTNALANKENLLAAGNNILITTGLPNTLIEVDGKTLQIYPDANSEFTVQLLDPNAYQVRQGQIMKLLDLTPQEEEQEQVTGNRYTIKSEKAIIVIEPPDQDNVKKATIYDGDLIILGEAVADGSGLVPWDTTKAYSYLRGSENIDITNGVISTVGNTIKNLNAGNVRIWDLDAGVYQLSDNTTSIVYYNGATSTTGMLGVCGGLLYVHLISSSTKSWFLMSDNMSDPYFYMGSTTSSAGNVTRLMKKSEIANNLTTTADGYMLDARQGKVLNDTKASKDPFTGTDGLVDGAKGLVPAPTTADDGKFLCADGTWQAAGGGSTYSAGDYIDITNDVISVTGIVSTGGGGTPLTLTAGQYYKAESDGDTPTLVTEANSGYYLLENTTNETQRYTIKFSAAIGDYEFVAFSVNTNDEVIYDRINDVYHNFTGSTKYYVDKGYGTEISPGEKIIISCRNTDLYPPSAVLFSNPQNETVLQPIVDYAVSYNFSPVDPSKWEINIYQEQGWQYYVFENTGAGAVFGCETTCDCNDSSFYYVTDGDGFVIGQSDSSVDLEDGYFAVYLETGGKLYINCYPPYVAGTPYVKILSPDAPAVLDDYALKTDLPKITYGTTDLTPGTSPLEEGTFYFVYE